MLVGDGWGFIHIPKCGGTAIRSVLDGREVGSIAPLGSKRPVHSPWHRTTKKRPTGRIFVIVRHPAEWLHSYWADQSPERVKGQRPRYLHQFWNNDLDQFVENVCTHHPGYVSALYRSYMAYDRIKVFRLEDGLARALKWATGRNIHVPTLNTAPSIVQMSMESRRTIVTVEQSAITKYGYDMKRSHNVNSYYGKTASNYDKLRQSTPGRQKERQAIQRLIKEGPVLDAACGTGAFSDIYRNFGHGYGHNLAIDASNEMLDICRRKHPWLATRQLDLLEPLPFADQHFAIVLCVRFFWWMKDGDMQQVMTELRRVSRSLVFSIRISPIYGRPENSKRKSLGHTKKQLSQGLGGWRVTDNIVIAGDYRMMRAVP